MRIQNIKMWGLGAMGTKFNYNTFTENYKGASLEIPPAGDGSAPF